VYEKPKELSKYAIVLVATDGYTVVYSWNELFNSPTGNTVYLLTQVNGKPLHSCLDRLYSLCVSDVNSGRRFVKGLSAIKIKQL
ncbi:MAG: molybdopterin-binding protein, partial [Bacteriodetes bacterium]|nr:molybdopterin-binding protein [Bacteroidota bacterium]